ncbi:MAG: hypothetical protein QOH86_1992 [Sphingomonadales bacterium]|nr:hypothetical protein [Sphingomonadales bacterium]
MSLRRIAAGLLALSAASALQAQPAGAEAPPSDLVAQFRQICGPVGEAGPSLPGNDVAASEAPGFFADDLRRAVESRVVKTGDRYAMRAIVPTDFDPQHAVFLKCAVAAQSTAFAEQVDRLSALLAAKPSLGKTGQGLDFAQFMVGTTIFAVFSEPDGWVSIFKMELMMRNIDPKYLKKGAKPMPAPSVR